MKDIIAYFNKNVYLLCFFSSLSFRFSFAVRAGFFFSALPGFSLPIFITSYNNKALFYSLATGFFIGMYSLTDGYGARISLSPLSFLGWSFILNAMIFPFTLKFINCSNVFSRVIKEAKVIFWVGGTLSYIVYAIVVWAFTKVPIPLVAALRAVSYTHLTLPTKA